MTDIVYLGNDNRAISQLQINAQNALLWIEASFASMAGCIILQTWRIELHRPIFVPVFRPIYSKLFYVLFWKHPSALRIIVKLVYSLLLLFCCKLQSINFTVLLSFCSWMKVFLTFCTVCISRCNINNNNFVYYLCNTYKLLLRSSLHMTLEKPIPK